MVIKSIKYIGFYDFSNSTSKRVCNLAATNKMNYISSAVKRVGYDVEIVSPSWMGEDTEVKFEKQKTINIDDDIRVTFCPSWKTNNKIMRNIKIIFSLVWLFLYLIFYVKKKEKVLAYHVQWISLPIRAAKFIKRFELILEVEEIYGEVWSTHKKLYSIEKKLINSADSYIFVSDILKERLKRANKEHIVLYGSYNVLPIEYKKNDSLVINLIYAGSIDSTKGGAYKAVESMRYLPDNYKLHILGHGSPKHISQLEELINLINEQRHKEVCTYAGVLHGQDYSNYLFQCDIALNPQIQGEHMTTAFPSKVLSYLSHNLRVVSTQIESIKKSSISDYIFFANDDKPKSIAEAILNIDLSIKCDSTKLIKSLDKKFVQSLKELLENKYA